MPGQREAGGMAGRSRRVSRSGRVGGLRVLVVEDEFLIAAMIGRMLQELDCEVVHVGRVADALGLAVDEPFDGALLDINVAGTLVYPVADALRARRVPFVFVTGYETVALPYRDNPLISKPISDDSLARSVAHFRRRTFD